MKITYTSPNRSHHYPYAAAMHRAGLLHAFITGFSRFSPRSPLPEIGEKLKRHDFFQTLYIAGMHMHLPFPIERTLNRMSAKRLDSTSYKYAKESDVFIYYRTHGLETTKRLHKEGSKTVCVMEEMNSHVEHAYDLLRNEFDNLGIKKRFEREPDHTYRLKTYAEADYILCPSEYVKRSFIQRGYPPGRILKVNYGFPKLSEISSEKNFPEKGKFRLLYVGQIYYRKGLRYAIEAFKKLNHPDKEFVIVGPKTSFTGLEKTSIPSEVRFTGVLKGEALINEYKKASMFVLPSIDEGLALVQLEAMTHGLPLLITTNTGGDDIVENGKQGFVVPPADTFALYEKLQQMADNDMWLREMSFAALEKARHFNNWDDSVNMLQKYLSEILSKNELPRIKKEENRINISA